LKTFAFVRIHPQQRKGIPMQMLSGRVPDDLYQWFASVEVERAVTTSDKLRVLLGQLKRQYDGSLDYVSALSWFRDLAAPLRQTWEFSIGTSQSSPKWS
jgi:hypothetical protein